MRIVSNPAALANSIFIIATCGSASRPSSSAAPMYMFALPSAAAGSTPRKLATASTRSWHTEAARSLHPGRSPFSARATLTSMASRLEDQLKALPARPGVYLFRDRSGDVLYVGKAKSLRPRVRSYFQQSADTRTAIRQLPERVADVEVIVTQNEVEALHLEQNLVKRHRPPFNVRLRDDKSFPYIAVTVEDEYPRVMFTRQRHRRR